MGEEVVNPRSVKLGCFLGGLVLLGATSGSRAAVAGVLRFLVGFFCAYGLTLSLKQGHLWTFVVLNDTVASNIVGAYLYRSIVRFLR